MLLLETNSTLIILSFIQTYLSLDSGKTTKYRKIPLHDYIKMQKKSTYCFYPDVCICTGTLKHTVWFKISLSHLASFSIILLTVKYTWLEIRCFLIMKKYVASMWLNTILQTVSDWSGVSQQTLLHFIHWLLPWLWLQQELLHTFASRPLHAF